jgi:hypothetical protein
LDYVRARGRILAKFDSYAYVDIPKPQPKPGQVVIAVKGFGINHVLRPARECQSRGHVAIAKARRP